MNNFDGQTWVAFSDLSGLKAMYIKDVDQAAAALDKFYNTTYSLQENDELINSIVVSDCAVFWIDRQDCLDCLATLLRRLQEFHQQLLPDYLLRTTIAYGHFKYEQRLEIPRIRKNMIVGRAYLDAYANNDRVDHGAIVIVTLPENISFKELEVAYGRKDYMRRSSKGKGYYEYFWAVKTPRKIKDFLNKREEANAATFAKLKELYTKNQ